MPSPPRVAVVVPVYRKLPLTLRFLNSFRRVVYPAATVVIVDDGSGDGTPEAVRAQYPDAVVLSGDGNLWWAGATNKGVEYALAQGFDYVLTINNDTLVEPDFLDKLVTTAEAPSGPDVPGGPGRRLVGSRVMFLDPPDLVWALGGRMRWKQGQVFHLNGQGLTTEAALQRVPGPTAVEVLTGCGTLVPVAAYRALGGYDAKMCPQYHGDAEFVLRAAKHGWPAVVEPHAVVYNDAINTSVNRNPFSRRSPWYWRPWAAVMARYCPPRYLPVTLGRQLAGMLWRVFVPPKAPVRRRPGPPGPPGSSPPPPEPAAPRGALVA